MRKRLQTAIHAIPFLIFVLTTAILTGVLTACSGESAEAESAVQVESAQVEEAESLEEEEEDVEPEIFLAEAGNGQQYYVRVNRTTNCVTIYELDEDGVAYTAIQSMICSVGKNGNTPCGDFELGERYQWRELYGNVYGQYAVRIVDSILFHSVPYLSMRQDTLKTEEFDKLGTAASEGCIRLQVIDAKWIYDNCEEGTVVTIFDGTEADDPLGRPEAPVLTDSEYPDWDPTDPIAANPWTGGDGVLPTYRYASSSSETTQAETTAQESTGDETESTTEQSSSESSGNLSSGDSSSGGSGKADSPGSSGSSSSKETSSSSGKKETTAAETTAETTTAPETTPAETKPAETSESETTASGSNPGSSADGDN